MSLRSKLILAFLIMSVVPLTLIVLYSYVTSLESLRLVALAEVLELTAEIGERIEAIRRDVDQGVERLSAIRFGEHQAEEGMLVQGDLLLSEIDVALGAAAPFVESLEFLPVPPPPAVEAELAAAEAPTAPPVRSGITPAMPAVVISLRESVAALPESGEQAEKRPVPESGEAGLGEIEVRAALAGSELGAAWLELDIEQLMAEAGEVEKSAGEARRVLLVERLQQADSEREWRSDLLEQDEIEALEERVRESQRLLGQEFGRSIEQEGRPIGRLRAQVSVRKVLHQVLRQAERDQGEIPFALDGEGNLYVAVEADRQLLAGLPLAPVEGAAQDSVVDDWVIVRVRDAGSDLIYGIARPIGGSLADLRQTAGRNLAVGLGLVALALVGIAPLSRRITRDLNSLSDGVAQLATGDLEARVPVHSRDEVGRLARSFNRMAEDLQRNQVQLLEEERLRKENEFERRLLEAENERKSRELEDARVFQLSLLPKRLPQHPRLEIAVFMKTATEVGGDYYDFSETPDGSLVAAIGDATGHGARAGTMVTVIKSLFSSAAGQTGLADFLDGASQAIRQMELGRMAMALTLVRFADDQLTVAAAGMPPILVRRLATDTVEEIAVEGVPLGSMSQYNYVERQVDLAPGDAVLLMSDGFPELTNATGEPLGYKVVHRLFGEAADGTPQELIARLAEAANDWTGGANPSDDITFVAVRVKS